MALPVAVPVRASGSARAATVLLDGGSTQFHIVDSLAAVLNGASITVRPAPPAGAPSDGKPGSTVMLESGQITLAPLGGSLTYAGGGFRFADGQAHQLDFTHGQADLSGGIATALVNGSPDNRIPFARFKLDPAKVRLEPGKAALSGTVTMTSSTAVALNLAFGKTIFRAGEPFLEYSSEFTIAPVTSDREPMPSAPTAPG
ncbi:hypothetical protein [Streptomyces sp. ISL-11]|uniref:hypothetical protein n=1 Tax=Streptomyces sp. ISL-11 TaxID=2819174 RepID=UPI001BE8E27F|nr:hypothetical protein [Streptomyces sp. ISL-11]MBT2384953.1 hypothetical protein [Streptomyces sp. ISL-11]